VAPQINQVMEIECKVLSTKLIALEQLSELGL
jgi:hypothetical protein